MEHLVAIEPDIFAQELVETKAGLKGSEKRFFVDNCVTLFSETNHFLDPF